MASPNVPTALSVTSPSSDTTPSFQCSISDPDAGDTGKAVFTIYPAGSGTVVGTVESSTVSFPATVTAEYTTGLAGGSYEVTAYATDATKNRSAETSRVAFSIAQIVNKDLELILDVKSIVNKDLQLILDVLVLGTVNKDLDLVLDVRTNVEKDLQLILDVEPPWLDIVESPTTWTLVPVGD